MLRSLSEFIAAVWAVRESDESLRDALSREVAAMRADGRLARLSRRWIKVTVKVK